MSVIAGLDGPTPYYRLATNTRIARRCVVRSPKALRSRDGCVYPAL